MEQKFILAWEKARNEAAALGVRMRPVENSKALETARRLLSGNRTYHESHNAFFDAMDELEIMRFLMHRLEDYCKL